MSLLPPDLQELVTIIANISIIVSLPVIMYELWLSKTDTTYNTYEKLMSDFSDSTFFLVDHPKLANKFYVGKNKPKKWDKYDEDTKVLYSYLASLLGLFERAWVLHREVKFWKESWEQWATWIEELVTNDTFVDVFDDDKNLYDPCFVAEIQRIIGKVRGK